MFHGWRHIQGLRLFSKPANAFRSSGWSLNQFDPDGLRYVATIAVRVHWLISAFCLIELVYRPSYGIARGAAYVLLLLTFIGFNGYIQYLLRSNRPITWHWLLALCTMDLVLVSAVVAMNNGFSSSFIHLFYYPALAAFAVMFTSFRLNIAWVTMVSLVYLTISLTVGDGLNMETRDEKVLLARIVVMYVVVATVNVASRFERIRWQRSVERERALERERVELSQGIHDTAAQSAYMVGLGIDSARALAGDSNPELNATLEATSRLTRSMIWGLRHPINMGGIYQGRELGRVLRSHATSFTNVSSVPAEMTLTGVEPPLSTGDRSLLFSIAHNALANAYRHSEASRVSIELDYSGEGIRLSVSDDGTGLPGDYAERGHGFASMRRDAGRLGGSLVVEARGPLGGATVTCVVPAERIGSEDR